ncbi:MAG: OmpA family protein [Verrucomicrobiales bacterium]|nr:OmpA family protein [Verrucomicrobiales bacterium]
MSQVINVQPPEVLQRQGQPSQRENDQREQRRQRQPEPRRVDPAVPQQVQDAAARAREAQERAARAARQQAQQQQQQQQQNNRPDESRARQMAEERARQAARQQAQQQQQNNRPDESRARQMAEERARQAARQQQDAREAVAERAREARERAEQAARQRAQQPPNNRPDESGARQMVEDRARQQQQVQDAVAERARQARERAEAVAGEQQRQNSEALRERARRMAEQPVERSNTDESARRAAERTRDMAEQARQANEAATQRARERAREMAQEAAQRDDRPRQGNNAEEVERVRRQAREIAEEAGRRGKGRPEEQDNSVTDEVVTSLLRGIDLDERTRRATRERAQNLNNRGDAAELLVNVLAPPASSRRQASDRDGRGRDHRLPPERVGRTQDQRVDSVAFIIQRLLGRVGLEAAPPTFYSRHGDRDRHRGRRHDHDHYHFYFGNHRVVRYTNYSRIPPVLLASRQLGYVSLYDYAESPYRPGVANVDPRYYSNVPASYLQPGAYSVSYEVDPNSAVSRDDILFRQGSTAFADSLSYDLVVDIAEAIQSSSLRGEKFVIEGHASAEGSYDSNLELSQNRAERIARDLVAYGVDPTRLVPVGYGETEAQYPASAAETLRALDRRVTVFRLKK